MMTTNGCETIEIQIMFKMHRTPSVSFALKCLHAPHLRMRDLNGFEQI